jgi:hypothetical protein
MAGFHQSLTSTQLARRCWSAAKSAGWVAACWGVLIGGSVGRGPAALAQRTPLQLEFQHPIQQRR